MKKIISDFWYDFKQSKGSLAGLFIVSFFIFLAIFSNQIAPFPADKIFDQNINQAPSFNFFNSKTFILGTDDLGRDVFSRVIHGSRLSIRVGFFVVLFSMIIGTILGLISGWYENKIPDFVISRVVETLMSLPSILLAIIVVAILGPGLTNAVWAVSFVSIPGYVRTVRSKVLVEKQKQYINASRTFGASSIRQMFLNILPNCLNEIIVLSTLGFSDAILNTAALGFLGLGAQPPMAEWGTMLSDARAFIESSPWLVTIPGLCILLTVLGFNLLGDGLRDILDPKNKKN